MADNQIIVNDAQWDAAHRFAKELAADLVRAHSRLGKATSAAVLSLLSESAHAGETIKIFHRTFRVEVQRGARKGVWIEAVDH